jgi:putative N6-adenine-specific DNA methylase
VNTLFVSCLPGLEDVLGQEIASLGYTHRKSKGGLYVPFQNMEQIYRLNLELRTASRVLLPLHQFPCKDKNDLYRGAMKVDWVRYFKHFPTFAIDPVVHHENLTNSLFCAQLVKDAICDTLNARFHRRPDVDTKNPELSLHLFIFNDQATISFDTSGLPLHARGYRLEAGIAPLRESLAAALLLISGYSANDFLVDPCCGSGTLLIEAALIATNTAPGLLRSYFGFFAHPEFSEADWNKLCNEARKRQIPLAKGRIAGIEADSKAVHAAKKAIDRANLSDAIEIILGDFRDVEPPFEPSFIIANPPYGVRLQATDDLCQLYQDLGDFLKSKAKKPARGAIITCNLELAKCIGLRPKKRHVISNGGIEGRLLEYDLY